MYVDGKDYVDGGICVLFVYFNLHVSFYVDLWMKTHVFCVV